MSEKHLKSKQYYIDLYDRHTVERCRRLEQVQTKDDDLAPESEELTKEQIAGIRDYAQKFIMRLETGERYLNKEQRISEWMEADKAKDELLESAQAPEGIRCLSCRSLVKPTWKDLYTQLDKEDRVLFMYDCLNGCLPRRAFFNTGEEWRVKADLCPSCSTKLDREENNSEEKLVTKYTCPKCSYAKTDELVWTHKKDEKPDEKFAEDRDRFCLTDEEGRKYQDEKWQLERMAKFSEEWKKIEEERAKKLEENPKGFHLEGAGYTCFICGQSTPEGDNWYDKYGIKCLVCQKAIDEGEIPASLAENKDSWYSKFDLEHYFNVKHHTLRRWLKEGIIKPRDVSYFGKGTHVQLFLIEDNKDFLPPKNLLKSQSVEEIIDGKKYHHSEPWYRFVDPFVHLKGYKILDYMRVVTENEEKDKSEK